VDAEPVAELAFAARPGETEDLDPAGILREEPFEDLDRRRLPRAVRSEQPEALAAEHLERQPVDRHHAAVLFPQALAGHRRFAHG
jgi:hypothetical protein